MILIEALLKLWQSWPILTAIQCKRAIVSSVKESDDKDPFDFLFGRIWLDHLNYVTLTLNDHPVQENGCLSS